MRLLEFLAAHDQYQARSPGVYSYNLFSISEADHQRLLQLYHAFFNDMRRLVAASEPSERVVLFVTHPLPLDAPEPAAAAPPR